MRSHGSKRAASLMRRIEFWTERAEGLGYTLQPRYRAGWTDTAGNRLTLGTFDSEADAEIAISGARFLVEMTAIDVEYGRGMAIADPALLS